MIDGLADDYPIKQSVAISGSPLQMIDTQTKVYGSGNISFRIGLTTTTVLDSVQAAPRYAIVLVRYDGYTKNHLIYLRQGEAADEIAGSAKFSPYNVSTTAYEFIDYPTKVGGYKQWSSTAQLYPPSGSPSSTPTSTDTIANICPTGYSIPTQDDFRTLIYNQYYGASGGLYADGYFDRQTITYTKTSNGNIEIDCPSVGSGDNLAYAGIVCYNTNTYASVFFPFGGRKPLEYTSPENGGVQGFYWTTTLGEYSANNYLPYYFNPVYSNNTSSVFANVSIWAARTDACTIRPVADQTSPSSTNSSLGGFTDENGWE